MSGWAAISTKERINRRGKRVWDMRRIRERKFAEV